MVSCYLFIKVALRSASLADIFGTVLGYEHPTSIISDLQNDEVDMTILAAIVC
jgi:hypothetical protein